MTYLSEILPQLEQIQNLTEVLGIGGYIALDDRNIINFLIYRDQWLITARIIDGFLRASHIDTPCYFEEEMKFHLQLFKVKIKENARKSTKQKKLDNFLNKAFVTKAKPYI